MEVLMPIMLIFVLGGFFLYNPVRRKYSGVIGVVGSYLTATGLIMTMMIIAAIFIPSMRDTLDGDIASVIISIVFVVATVLYLVFIMITRCKTILQRIMLPFAVIIIAFGFATRLMASIFLHLPMENGKSNDGATSVFPKYLIDSDGNTWELMNGGYGDNAEYYCSKYSGTRSVHISDFQDGGLPAGFYRRG